MTWIMADLESGLWGADKVDSEEEPIEHTCVDSTIICYKAARWLCSYSRCSCWHGGTAHQVRDCHGEG
jgi:hypothetical protein